MKHAINKGDHKYLSPWQWGALCLCLVLFVALRSEFIGHLLVWDEAMNLCTVQSFATQGSDDFSNWFWTHPPHVLSGNVEAESPSNRIRGAGGNPEHLYHHHQLATAVS
ncbi:MAG TPA: hypothetical protein EYG38_18860, partial [Verrucomicrobia bacterium]|nr:hypothetical protein [Verrucomicrobiota bacterium]